MVAGIAAKASTVFDALDRRTPRQAARCAVPCTAVSVGSQNAAAIGHRVFWMDRSVRRLAGSSVRRFVGWPVRWLLHPQRQSNHRRHALDTGRASGALEGLRCGGFGLGFGGDGPRRQGGGVSRGLPPPPETARPPDPGNVSLHVLSVKAGRLRVVPLAEDPGGRSFSHPVPGIKILQLLVPPLEHGQDLGVGPRVHGDRPDAGDRDAVGPVPARAHRAQQDPVRDAGPVRVAVAAIHAPGVPRDGPQEPPARSREGCAVRVDVVPGLGIVEAEGFQLGGNRPDRGRVFCCAVRHLGESGVVRGGAERSVGLVDCLYWLVFV